MTSQYQEYLTEGQFKILNELLKSIGNGSNYSLTFSSGLEGTNWCSIIVSVEVKWNEKVDMTTQHFIIKIMPLSAVIKSFIPIEACYEREIYLYSKVFKDFQTFQTEKQVLQHFNCYPHFYKTPTASNEILVLKDMKKAGFNLVDMTHPLNYDHIVLVLREYAKLHALSLAMRDQNPDAFDEHAKNTPDHFFKLDVYALAEIGKHRIVNALKSLDPVNDKILYEQFSYYYNNMASITAKRMSEINRYSVISHIDNGISNFLFSYEDQSHIPTNVCILDWQLSRITSPAVDLSTFIFSASDKELRYRFDELILEYHKTLSLALENLGSDVNKLLPFHVLQEELKTYSVIGLFFIVQLIYAYTSTENVPNVHNDDSFKDGYSFLYKVGNLSAFNERIRDVLIDFHRYGYNFC